jgi:hypothetical protein
MPFDIRRRTIEIERQEEFDLKRSNEKLEKLNQEADEIKNVLLLNQ